jgi:hypothetical protein
LTTKAKESLAIGEGVHGMDVVEHYLGNVKVVKGEFQKSPKVVPCVKDIHNRELWGLEGYKGWFDSGYLSSRI